MNAPSRRSVLICGLASAGLAACDRERAAAPGAGELQPLRLCIDKWPGFLAAGLADALGWFQARGLRLDVHFEGNSTSVHLSDFLAGKYDAMGCALGDLLMFSRNQSNAQVLLVTDESTGADALLMRSGTAMKGPRRLRVGFASGSYANLFVEEFLGPRGLPFGTWDKLEVDAADVNEKLLSGEIDIGHTWEPYLSKGVAQGLEVVFSSAQTPGLVLDMLVVTPSAVARREAQLRAFAKIWFEAVDWWLAHPEDATRLIARRFALMPEEVSLKGLRLLTLADNHRLFAAIEGPNTLGSLARRYSDFFVSRGMVAKPVAVSQLVGPGLLP
jgi:NitT/TauT family transport system substrate-binding protein